jgi:hypothetical protein
MEGYFVSIMAFPLEESRNKLSDSSFDRSVVPVSLKEAPPFIVIHPISTYPDPSVIDFLISSSASSTSVQSKFPDRVRSAARIFLQKALSRYEGNP